MHWLLVGYMFLFIHRPFEVYLILGDFYLERIYMIGLIAFWAIFARKRLPINGLHIAYFLFATSVLFAWMLSPWMDKGQLVVENWFKIVVFYTLMVTSVSDPKRLRQLCLGFMTVMFVYMLHSFKEYLGGRHTYRMGISRMVGVDSSLGDPNSFGGSIVYALPVRQSVLASRTRVRDALDGRWLFFALGFVHSAHRVAFVVSRDADLDGVGGADESAPTARDRRLRDFVAGRFLGTSRFAAKSLRDDHQPGSRAGKRPRQWGRAIARSDSGGRTLYGEPAERLRPRRVATGDRQRHRIAQFVRPTRGRTWSSRCRRLPGDYRRFLLELVASTPLSPTRREPGRLRLRVIERRDVRDFPPTR